MRSFVRFFGIAAAAILLSFSPPAQADITWNVPSGDWSVATNWSGGATPTSTDNADIFNGGTVTIATTGNACRNLSIDSATGSGSLQVGSGQLSVSYSTFVGVSGTGTVLQSGGTVSIFAYQAGLLYLGYNAGSCGNYTLSGNADLAPGWAVYVGYNGTGNFTQSGGTNTGIPIYIGYNFGSSGNYNLSGGLVSPGYGEYVGYSGTGSVTQSGGTTSLYGTVFLGYSAASSGTYSLSTTGQLLAGTETIGNSGAGSFTQSGGTNTISHSLCLGYYPGSSGSYALGSGQLSAPTEVVGNDPAATAAFQQAGGSNAVTSLTIGPGGQYQLAGGTLQVSGAGLVSQGVFDGGGPAGTGTLTGSSCIIDLSQGTLQNVGSLAVNMGPAPC